MGRGGKKREGKCEAEERGNNYCTV